MRQPRVPVGLEGVSETLLIPLWARAAETKRSDPIIFDPKAVEICDVLDYDFTRFDRAWMTQTGIAVRTRLIDEAVLDRIAGQPETVFINLGAGLDTRFERVDNGRILWYEVDLPEVIEVRRHFFTETQRHRCISRSIIDFTWTEEVDLAGRAPLIIAEGLFMYFDEGDVRAVFRRLAQCFSGAEMIFEVLTPLAVGMGRFDECVSKVGGGQLEFKWSMTDCREIETWDCGIKLCSEWNVLDYCKRRWGYLAFMAPLFFNLLGNRVARVRFGA
ncbi:MAG TPA: class I SAM-dependent methyltransferase [Syntrophales bacterium]|nr:class I SAM-dependent methyltransferase [Syntrophales bacterium]HPI57991.1 class I SAM-dependent methyltransferase [Syntrophales bacterium]HPN25881.1 class I SAM-dependent methyltransferase [Syntrophales bacterium]HQM29563.1 class I SAM-dependent methyltransferase [Syntrophales bacterium]